MASSVIDWMRKVGDTAKRTSKALKADNDFINNYRAIINEQASPETTEVSLGNKGLSNKITFRNAKIGEKTGLQKVSLLKSNGDKEDIFLIVPERESVGYGNIRGWGSPDSENMKVTKSVSKSMAGKPTSNAKNLESYAYLGTIPYDLVLGNTINNNITKNEKSNYTGPDKAVGFGNANQSEGQIFGMITSDGEMITPQETQYFLSNLKKNGYKGVTEIEQPERVQEHTGPAYVPGDILLGLLGLQPNRGAVGYTFKGPSKNSQYQTFVKNLRNSGRKKQVAGKKSLYDNADGKLHDYDRPNYFYYTVPDGLIEADEVPGYAGLIYGLRLQERLQ